MMNTYRIESYKPVSSITAKERLVIKAFPTSDAMHRFLGTKDNALRWRETTKWLKPGTYAYAGGQWHNVKNLDASVLAHI